MNYAVRALEGFVGAGTLLFTISWGMIELQNFDNYAAFVSEMVPFPLLLPVFAGLLTIINIELLLSIMTQANEDEAMLTKTEKQVGGAVMKRTKQVTNWNSRWDRKERE